MTTGDVAAMETALEIEEALTALSDRRDELMADAAADLLDRASAIKVVDLDVELADRHYEAVLRGVDKVISELRSVDDADLRELARLAAIPFVGRRRAADDDLRALRPPPVAADPVALTFDDDDDEYYRDDEVRRVLSENVEDQAHHLRYLASFAADVVSTAVAIGETGDTDRALATLQMREAVITALRTTFKAWEIALATLDDEAPGSAAIASEMIGLATAVLRHQDGQDQIKIEPK